MKQGMIGGQFWAAYVPCESQHLNAVQLTLEQIDVVKRLIEKYNRYLKFATSATEILEAHQDSRIASLIGVEGGHSIGNSLAILRIFYDLGVRYLTLTHTCNTPWADSSSIEHKAKFPRNGGLTPFGKVGFIWSLLNERRSDSLFVFPGGHQGNEPAGNDGGSFPHVRQHDERRFGRHGSSRHFLPFFRTRPLQHDAERPGRRFEIGREYDSPGSSSSFRKNRRKS